MDGIEGNRCGWGKRCSNIGLQGVGVVWYSYTSKNSIVAGTLEWYLRTEGGSGNWILY